MTVLPRRPRVVAEDSMPRKRRQRQQKQNPDPVVVHAVYLEDAGIGPRHGAGDHERE
jgi:hypothetical protein